MVKEVGKSEKAPQHKYNHVDLVQLLGIVDLDAGTKVAGGRGFFLKGAGVLLNQALINCGLQFAFKRGYEPLQTPFFMRKSIMAECAQLSQFDEELYHVRCKLLVPPLLLSFILWTSCKIPGTFGLRPCTASSFAVDVSVFCMCGDNDDYLLLCAAQLILSKMRKLGTADMHTPVALARVFHNAVQLCMYSLELSGGTRAEHAERCTQVSGEGEDKYLIATSEQPLCAMLRGSWLEPEQLPKRYVGYSTCFRKEAGAHGRDTLGIFRVHQFEKVEQFVVCSPDDGQSWELMDEMLGNAEAFYQVLANAQHCAMQY